jgi:hypothetical protein
MGGPTLPFASYENGAYRLGTFFTKFVRHCSSNATGFSNAFFDDWVEARARRPKAIPQD